jgi:hypothetical protein
MHRNRTVSAQTRSLRVRECGMEADDARLGFRLSSMEAVVGLGDVTATIGGTRAARADARAPGASGPGTTGPDLVPGEKEER